ncbi:MAG: hypothetical protein LLF83_07700 [Methanobacterium sp.]|nr:hypothetical protein [Methanobacterium sp.]
MDIVKCKECGKKFQINEEENPRKFQCYCGGDLEYHIKKPEEPLNFVTEFKKSTNNSYKKNI